MDNKVQVQQIRLEDILATYHTCKSNPNITDFKIFVEINGEVIPVTAITTKVDGTNQMIFKVNSHKDIEVI